MAPVDKKRKSGSTNPTNESFARSSKILDGDDRPAKRFRPNEKDGRATTVSKIPQVPRLSRAREEEAAFPRGGASILTPLEHKQIQIEATRDVLFEQHGSKSSRADTDGADGRAVGLAKRKSESKGKGKKGTAPEPEDDSVKIEGLSYKVRCDLILLIIYF